MATVYLAHDLRHDRKVALKVLRAELAAVIGAERFLAEIKTTANLQHPHILPLHDSGEAEGIVYYVMPYVEGESLRERLLREKQLPVEDAIRITREVAAALDYAHRHGVIHRDIKPENILLHDGAALVADFGIALAVSRSEGGARMTDTGMSLGTPHYMSPEQAMGERELSPRSDVYALGCVLYEMLVGEPPFTGPTPQAIVAKVITEKPPLATTARESVPRHVARAIQKALAKLPADRFASAPQMADALGRPGWADAEEVADAPPSSPAAASRQRRVVAGLGILSLLLLGVGVWGWLRPAPSPRTLVTYVKFAPSEAPAPGGVVADLSPDGNLLVYLGPVEGSGFSARQRIWLKPRGELHSTPLAGTEGAQVPFFSPDSRWIAFFQDGKLKKIPAGGGGIVSLANAPTTYLWGDWLDDGRIVYAGPAFSLLMVNENGGPIDTLVSDVLKGGRAAVGVIPLPGSSGIVFAACGLNCTPSDVWAVDLKTRKQQQVLSDGIPLGYLPSGHLLYTSLGSGVLLAAPFDPSSLKITGPGVPVLEGLPRFGVISFSQTGTLIYQEGKPGEGGTPVWVTRDGRASPVDSSWRAEINSLALSPDGKRLAVSTVTGQNQDVWIKELDRGPLSRLTFGEAAYLRMSWSPDGRFVLMPASGKLFLKRADGTGPTTEVGTVANHNWAEAGYSPDARWLILRSLDAGPTRDIYALSATGDTLLRPLVSSQANEFSPTLSPDGKWLAYVAQETGRGEVYVRPFPNADSARWQISTGGGTEPVWARNGRELFYIDQANGLVAAEIVTTPGFAVANRKVLFNVAGYDRDPTHAMYAVTPDGNRFLMIGFVGFGAGDLVLVENWFEILREKFRR